MAWGVSREEWVRRKCQSGEVEDVEHLVMRCTTSVASEREKLMRLLIIWRKRFVARA